MKAACIIVAAGKGTRLGAGTPKAFVKLNGIRLFEHSLRAYQASPSIAAIVLVVPPGLLPGLAPLFERYPKLTAIVPGGGQRQDSVRNGLAACPPGADVVLIHDAARPLVAARDIGRVVAATRRYGAAILAAPVTDTIKLVNGPVVARTLDRRLLWRAQTPQGFSRAVLAKSHSSTPARSATDDSMLAERIGVKVRIVPDTGGNIKVTTPHDLEVAAWLLKRR
ncbi:MAG: 2-C-methyl-D-erythritol 4-phosphate cytidylyltransferase [Candidatus Edwardsbacteria bacterium]|jgi:2-C-methyl-D-erythritol 4-phosphate cytidylyltransferase|nr:2-C-methyl-D-erythritol 4-phosphate cytidylyltransferase [Candidatus Edwardsbacteria bacterium]